MKELRWAAPQDPEPWSDTLEAHSPGPACPQPGKAGGQGGVVPSTTEDCLYLNVWRPLDTTGESRLPVIVWFHGGGMVFGASHLFRAERLVSQGRPVLVVTVNYRLGIFGFLAHPGLDLEQPDMGSGNYGVQDQQFALEWIKHNISQFGGVPENVTIAGESGGAQSVCLLLVSPPAKGLFYRAISQSGPCQYNFPTLHEARETGLKIAERLDRHGEGKEAVSCLRARAVSSLLDNMIPGAGEPGNGPSIGGGVLPFNVREAIAFDRWNTVPVMQGSNSDESLWHILPVYDGVERPIAPKDYRDALETYFGRQAKEVQLAYPAEKYPSPSLALARAVGDSGITYRIGACNTLLAHRLIDPSTTLFAYEFSDPAAPFPFEIYDFPTAGIRGAGHTAELSYLFDNNATLSPMQQRLSKIMIRYWTNFAATGNPNSESLPAWPPFTPENEWVLSLKPGKVAKNRDFRERHNCGFWRRLGLNTLYGFKSDPERKSKPVR